MSTGMLHQKRAERKARGAALLLSGAVRPTGEPHTYTVRSQQSAQVYVVHTGDNTCTCQDEWGRQYLGTCKHIEAARLFERLTQLHYRHSTRCYRLAEGWDVEIRCACGEVCAGFARTSRRDAYSEAVESWQEHVRIVLEHVQRNPANTL